MSRVSSHGHITPADESPTPTTAPVGISRELGLILKVFHLPSDHFHLIFTSIRSLPLDFHFHAVFTSFQEIRVITDKIAEDADSGDIEADWRFFLEYIKN